MNQHLKPASIAEISQALERLFEALPFQRGAKSDNVASAYFEALRGSTSEAIAAGVSKFLRGECEGVSPRYVPTPPELARIVRSVVVQRKNVIRLPVRPDPPEIPGAKLRMRLKMPMWRAAAGSKERLDALAAANAEGFAAMVALAASWGVPVPDEFNDIPEEELERQWHQARRIALAEIERNPPPYLRHKK